MKTVTLKKEREIRLGPYEYAAVLFPETAYLLSDRDAGDIAVKAGGGCTVGEARCRFYQGEDLEGKSLLCAVFGDYGEALIDIQMIRTLERKYPSAVIDVAAAIDTWMLFRQFAPRGAWRAYPLLEEKAEQYDFIAAYEGIPDPSFQSGRERTDWCRNLLGEDLTPAPLPPTLNPAMKRTMALRKSGHPTVVLHAGSGGTLNDYPAARWGALARLLSEQRCEIVLSGFDGDTGALPSLPADRVLGRDHSVFEILAVLDQADLIIAGDSFAARAGGLLGKKTLVLLNTADPEAYRLYPTAEVTAPAMPCAPCFRRDRCPLGHERCEAVSHESTEPERVAAKAIAMLEEMREDG